MVNLPALTEHCSLSRARCVGLVAVLGLACIAAPFQAGPASAQLGIKVDPAPLVAPITAPVNRSLNVMNRQVSRGLNQMTRQVNRGIGQANRSVNRSLNTLNSYSYRSPIQPRYPSTSSYRPRSLANQAPSSRLSSLSPQTLGPDSTPQRIERRMTEEQRVALQQHQQKLVKSQAALGILPPDVLTQLSDDQLGLQTAAQNAALDAEIGEIIEWTYEGVYGSAQALSETTLGTMRCREFEQKIVVNGDTQTAVGSACERGTGQWARSIF